MHLAHPDRVPHDERAHRPLQTVLALDAAVEFVAGAALIIFSSTLSGWLAIPSEILIALGIAFVAAGAAIVYLMRAQPLDLSLVRALAWANIAGGAIGWAILAAFWSTFDPEGRWTLAAVSDAFITIGTLELLALRRAT